MPEALGLCTASAAVQPHRIQTCACCNVSVELLLHATAEAVLMVQAALLLAWQGLGLLLPAALLVLWYC
jgi:hypothetical protein